VQPTVTLGGNTLPASTNTDLCQVCTVVGNNNNVCTSLSNCTPKTTAAVTTAPPAPTPSGSLCLVLWSEAFIGSSDDWEYGVFKPGDACATKNSVIIGSLKAQSGGVCELGSTSDSANEFNICGKDARFVNAGPVFKNIEKGENCGLQLQIDGVNYAGTAPDPFDKPCGDITCTAPGIAYGSSEGRMYFQNVPICDD
jgi:hypothetical protein